jgi:hypothetical protein
MMLSFWGRDCLDSDGGPGRLSRDRHALAGKRGELLVVGSKAVHAVSHYQSVGQVAFRSAPLGLVESRPQPASVVPTQGCRRESRLLCSRVPKPILLAPQHDSDRAVFAW